VRHSQIILPVVSILVYSEKVSGRQRYVFSVLLGGVLGSEVIYTDNEAEFKQSDLPKINYSAKTFDACLNLVPHSLLYDYGIKDYATDVQNHPVFLKVFFKTPGKDLPFDIFAAAFWLLSRYEEYLPHKTDAFNRFHYKSGLAWQNDFLHFPLVNHWMCELEKMLKNLFSGINFQKRDYNFISSVDVDNAWKYKHKGFVRTVAGYFSDLLKRDFEGMKLRTSIILNKTKDPFDCYDFLIGTNNRYGVSSLYFFLLGDYGVNDKNHSANNLGFQSLIKHMADYSPVGIHPSYGSTNNLHQVRVETSRLSAIMRREVFASRQHFSILKFPQTYQQLIQAGIHDDYSMGYTNMNGFRASFCYPYKWYNLDEELTTGLTIHPFSISENTVEFYAKKNDREFIELVKPVVNEVKKFGGELVSIFHNNNFTEKMRRCYVEFVELAATK
jgi:hypothetical protein